MLWQPTNNPGGSTGSVYVYPPQRQQGMPVPGVEGLAPGATTAPSGVTYQTVDPNALVSNQLTGLLNKGGAYIDNARAQGTQYAASRGLLNSAMGAGTSENAAISAALPIAQGNASEIAAVNAANAQAANQFTGENIAADAQRDAANAQITSASIAANTQLQISKQQFQEFGMNLGFQYAGLGQQGQEFTQQLNQNNDQFDKNLTQNWNMFKSGENLQVGEYQQNAKWQQYLLGYQTQMNDMQNYSNGFNAIMMNPNMTAADRSSAMTNLHDFNQQLTQMNSTIPAFIPAWSTDPGYWSQDFFAGG